MRTESEIALLDHGRSKAEHRLESARAGCDAAADQSYEIQALATRELSCAIAQAEEWGVRR